MSSTYSPVSNPPQQELIDPETVKPGKGSEPLWMTFMRSRLTRSWQHWFSDIFNFLQALTSSGTTANRPTKFIWIGRTYFDTTLNKPIWVKTFTGGAAVWVDATGTTV